MIIIIASGIVQKNSTSHAVGVKSIGLLNTNKRLLPYSKLWMQLQKLPVVLPNAAQGAARPHEAQGIAFLLSEMPVDVGRGMKAVGQRIQQQGRRHADVVALREAVHRYADVHVGMLDGIVREAEFLRAENQGDGLVQR